MPLQIDSYLEHLQQEFDHLETGDSNADAASTGRLMHGGWSTTAIEEPLELVVWPDTHKMHSCSHSIVSASQLHGQ